MIEKAFKRNRILFDNLQWPRRPRSGNPEGYATLDHQLRLPQTGVSDEGFLVVRTNTEHVFMRISILVTHQFIFNGVENTKYDAIEGQKYTDP